MHGSSYADGVGSPGAGSDATRILFVCTANQCRSVLAEAIARRRFDGRAFVFASAGLIDGGRPMPSNGVMVAREAGFEMSEHVSRRVDSRRLGEWDVVLTMSRQHTRELVAADAGLWPRVFTLPQFVRWLDDHPPARHAALRAWIELAGADRARSEMVGARAEDDIPDPVDGPPADWRQLVMTLTEGIDRIADHLIPEPGSDAHPSRHAMAEGRAIEQLGTAATGRWIHGERALDGSAQFPGVRRSE